mmetsp:Transcript_102695/g.295683  ORF Transcript_102695/g.295683 Transcript_102695/m.295683 type:complete len:220 (-) Transcript_102695:53-712(-)
MRWGSGRLGDNEGDAVGLPHHLLVDELIDALLLGIGRRRADRRLLVLHLPHRTAGFVQQRGRRLPSVHLGALLEATAGAGGEGGIPMHRDTEDGPTHGVDQDEVQLLRQVPRGVGVAEVLGAREVAGACQADRWHVLRAFLGLHLAARRVRREDRRQGGWGKDFDRRKCAPLGAWVARERAGRRLPRPRSADHRACFRCKQGARCHRDNSITLKGSATG